MTPTVTDSSKPRASLWQGGLASSRLVTTFQARRKGDNEKVKMAKRLRGETTMRLSWIAQRLAMGVAGCAAQRLRQTKKE